MVALLDPSERGLLAESNRWADVIARGCYGPKGAMSDDGRIGVSWMGIGMLFGLISGPG